MDVRTDLAVESCRENEKIIEGIDFEQFKEGFAEVERVFIRTLSAATKTGKPQGNYVTITVEDLSDNEKEKYEELCVLLAREIKKTANIKKDTSVLVVGLGNKRITADSIGPKAVESLLVTRHIKELMPEEVDERVRTVSALAPSVMAYTGIETGDIVKAVAEKTSPGLIIAIDSLASRSMARLGKTIQLSDTGINPGSGVGNNRKEISEKTLGIKVLAIGVPMVVDTKTVIRDCMEIACKEEGEKYIEKYNLTEPGNTEMVVTPKDVDFLSDRCGRIIANGINLALQPMGKEDIDRYN